MFEYIEYIGPDLLFPVGPDLLFPAGPDLLFPAGPDLLFRLVRGAILKYNETMRMVSQSLIMESLESLRGSICIHIRQTQSLSPHKVRGD